MTGADFCSWQLPVDGTDAEGLQDFVGLAEGFAAEEGRAAGVGAERAGMGGEQDSFVVGHDDAVHHGFCLAAPDDEYNRLRQIHGCLNDSMCKDVPAPVRMAVGLMSLYGQAGVQQQNALFGPRRQVAGRWTRASDIVAQLFEDVLKRRLNGTAVVDGECQTVGCARCMIRVLSDDAGLELVRRCQGQGAENLVLGRKNFDALPAQFVGFQGKAVAFLHSRFGHDVRPFHWKCLLSFV